MKFKSDKKNSKQIKRSFAAQKLSETQSQNVKGGYDPWANGSGKP